MLTGPLSIRHIHPNLNVPVRAILIQAVFNLLFGLIYLGPEVAFNAYIASCTLFLNLSYAAPVAILLIRGRNLITENPPEFTLGKGILGYVVNWVSVLFVAVTSVVSHENFPFRSSITPADDASSSVFLLPSRSTCPL